MYWVFFFENLFKAFYIASMYIKICCSLMLVFALDRQTLRYIVAPKVNDKETFHFLSLL